MNRCRLITLLVTALVLPTSHAQIPYEVDIPPKPVAPKPPVPTGRSETEIKELKRKLAAEEARRKAAEANSEGNRRKADAEAVAAIKQADNKVTEQLAAEHAKRQDVAEQAKRAADDAVKATAERERLAREADARNITPGTRLEAYPGGPVLIALPPGSFDMGSADGGSDKLHRVRVAQPFAIGETELSFAQWDACVNDTSHALRCKHEPENRWGRGDQPVMNVSYDDIVRQYLPWLNAKTGAKAPYLYRLPTEAEWEYAARAGGTGDYSFGPNNSDQIDSTKAQYNARHLFGFFFGKLVWIGEPREHTVHVKSFPPNAFGLHDMHGNVREFTADCYSQEEYERRKNSGEWLSNKTSKEETDCRRVVRGGSWDNSTWTLRSFYRDTAWSNGDHRTGFRLARTPLP